MLGLKIFVRVQTFRRRPYKRLRATSVTPEYNNDSLSTNFPQSLFVFCRLPPCGLKLSTLNLGLGHGTKLFLQQPHNSIFVKWVASGWQTSKVAATIVRSAEGRFSWICKMSTLMSLKHQHNVFDKILRNPRALWHLAQLIRAVGILDIHSAWQTSPKIGPSRCARFVFVILCNTLLYSVILCNTL